MKQFHAAIYARDDRGLEKVRAQLRSRIAAAQYVRASRNGIADQLTHALHMLRPDERADVGRRVTSRPETQPFRFFNAERDKFLRRSLLDKQPLHGKADLSTIRVAAPDSRAEGHFQVRIC